MKTGTELILAERHRQINEEGWTTENDDRYGNQELSKAAECYFVSASMTKEGFASFRPPNNWPWDRNWWKPSTEIRDLTKAGALWLAEIDRLKRLGKTATPESILKFYSNKVESCARIIDELLASK